MPLAVLIIAGESGSEPGGTLAAMLPFAGQTVLEYQIRLARACGGGHIVVLVEQLPGPMVAIFDRLRADGIDVDIARDPRDAADRIHPEEEVLLFAPGFVGQRQMIETLIARAKPTLVTLPDQPQHLRFERIDAADRWSGLALLKGQSIRQTAAMLGDWSISSTLMRSALQSGAERLRFETADDFTIINDAAEAEAMSAALVHNIDTGDQSVIADLITQPLARLIMPYLLKWSVPMDLIAVIPLILAGASLLLALLGWFATGFGLFWIATLAGVVADIQFKVAVRSNATIAFFNRARPFIFFALLLLTGFAAARASGDWAPLLLAGWSTSIFILQPSQPQNSRKWQPTLESGSLIMLLALMFSAPVAGLFLIVCHALAAQIADRFFRS